MKFDIINSTETMLYMSFNKPNNFFTVICVESFNICLFINKPSKYTFLY